MVIQLGHEPDPAKRIRKAQGKKLRQARKLKQISRQELADALKVTVGAVSQWENGTTSPRQHHQLAIAKHLDIPWSFIFGLDDQAVA